MENDGKILDNQFVQHQFNFDGDILTLQTKRVSLFLLVILYLITACSFLLPLSSIVITVSGGGGFKFGFLIGLIISSLVGLVLLRSSLWNTYGKEVLEFQKDSISYLADYGWFKDARKEINYSDIISFGFKSIGYEEERKGVLLIETLGEKKDIVCATKMPIAEIELLNERLNEKCIDKSKNEESWLK